jgi:hypothetical protein
MTDTPRTDAGCFDSFEHPLTEQNCECVTADFARTLERELAAMTARAEAAEADKQTLLNVMKGEAAEHERDLEDRIKAEAERDEARAELKSVLADWNDLVKASGSPTNGGAIGHVRAMRAELARLTTPVPLLEREETGGCILWARDEDGWFESARIGATHWTPLPDVKETK